MYLDVPLWAETGRAIPFRNRNRVPFLYWKPKQSNENTCFQWLTRWLPVCPIKGMTLTIILVALQMIVLFASLLRESGEDTRFEGEKLTFRS